MTTDHSNMLVLKDPSGSYFIIPQETLERGRVPAEHTAEVEGHFAAATAADVSGHAFMLGLFLGTILGGGSAIGALAYNLNNQSLADVIQDGVNFANANS